MPFHRVRAVRDGCNLLLAEPADAAADDAITILCVPGTMCSPTIFAGLSALGGRVAAAPWLEWSLPHDMATLGQAVADLAAQYRPVVLVGHSTGGVIAMSAALRVDPGTVVGLVVCDSGANTHGHGDVDAIIERVRAHWGPALWTAIAERSVYVELPEPIMTELAEYPSRITAGAVDKVLRSQRDTDLEPELHRLSHLPTLVVHGRHDTARTMTHAQQLASGLRRSELVVLDCGHTPPIEMPHLFAATVQRWLHRITNERIR